MKRRTFIGQEFIDRIRIENKQTFNDQAGFSDIELQEVIGDIDPRSPEQCQEDQEWTRKITQAIIARRKARVKAEQGSSEGTT